MIDERIRWFLMGSFMPSLIKGVGERMEKLGIPDREIGQELERMIDELMVEQLHVPPMTEQEMAVLRKAIRLAIQTMDKMERENEISQ